MNIIKQGRLAEAESGVAPYWDGYECQCAQCGAHFVLGKQDQVTTLAATERVPRHGEIVCPTQGCGLVQWIKIPSPPQPVQSSVEPTPVELKELYRLMDLHHHDAMVVLAWNTEHDVANIATAGRTPEESDKAHALGDLLSSLFGMPNVSRAPQTTDP